MSKFKLGKSSLEELEGVHSDLVAVVRRGFISSLSCASSGHAIGARLVLIVRRHSETRA
jgi:hypothetical protein